MIYINAERASTGAKELVAWLRTQGVRAIRLRGQAAKIRSKTNRKKILTFSPGPGDLLVNWGDTYHGPMGHGVKILNSQMVGNKKYELLKLAKAGVPVPQTSTVPVVGYVGRRANHTGGSDLLHPPGHPDFYVQKLPIVKEFRVHIFKGVSIRAGMKKPRTSNPHPWVRSWDGGWSIYYDGDAHANMKQKYRDIAKKALDALGYDFGAVDLGVTSSGSVVVFEVNSAPGLEGNTIAVYGQKILKEA